MYVEELTDEQLKLVNNMSNSIRKLQETLMEYYYSKDYKFYVGIDIAKTLVGNTNVPRIKGVWRIPLNVTVCNLEVILDITIPKDTFYLVDYREVQLYEKM